MLATMRWALKAALSLIWIIILSCSEGGMGAKKKAESGEERSGEERV
jgi:hypothetical protein